MSRHTLTSAERKEMPIDRGALAYFPDALLLVSMLSARANAKHAPGEPIQWVKGKSADHGDCLVRHQLDVGEMDPEFNLNYAVHVAWRGLAQLQTMVEEFGIEALFGPCPVDINISHITGISQQSTMDMTPELEASMQEALEEYQRKTRERTESENILYPAEGFSMDLTPVEAYGEETEPEPAATHVFTRSELLRTLGAHRNYFRFSDTEMEGPDA